MNTLSQSLLLGTLAFATALSNACVPTRWTNAPAIAGQVVSRRTNQPVVGATVSMTTGKAFAQTRTDGSGSFRLPALTHWGVLWLLELPQLSDGTLRVQAPGYHPLTTREGEVPEWSHVPRVPGVTYYPTNRDDSERVRIALSPDA